MDFDDKLHGFMARNMHEENGRGYIFIRVKMDGFSPIMNGVGE